MKIIVGLGNPGDKYKITRHNAGFMAVDFLVAKLGLAWEMNKKFNALIVKDGETLYVKPQTFMNNSGQSVQAVLNYYKLLPSKPFFPSLLMRGLGGGSDLSEVLTVIHDDLDIELGRIKESVDSRSAGHNGVQSIIDFLGTKNFKRIRIGIKSEMLDKIPAEKFVLQKFSPEELNKIDLIIENLKII